MADVAVPTPSPPKTPAPAELDIGRYDGGFEKENETRGEAVHGEAAQQLALDSSSARYVVHSRSAHDTSVASVDTHKPNHDSITYIHGLSRRKS